MVQGIRCCCQTIQCCRCYPPCCWLPQSKTWKLTKEKLQHWQTKIITLIGTNVLRFLYAFPLPTVLVLDMHVAQYSTVHCFMYHRHSQGQCAYVFLQTNLVHVSALGTVYRNHYGICKRYGTTVDMVQTYQKGLEAQIRPMFKLLPSGVWYQFWPMVNITICTWFSQI